MEDSKNIKNESCLEPTQREEEDGEDFASLEEYEEWLKTLSIGELLEIHQDQAREINMIRAIILEPAKK